MKIHVDRNLLRRAEKVQRLLAKRIEVKPLKSKPRIIGAVDLAYVGDLGVVSYIEVRYGEESPAAEHVEIRRISIPYIPTFLFLREGPPILYVLSTHKIEADVIMINGHGLTHPRRMGLATYIGVVTGIPTIGVAKKPLHGVIGKPIDPNTWTITVDGEEVGVRIKTKHGGYIYVSIGNKITLRETIKITLDNLGSHRLPTPLYHADRLSKIWAEKLRHEKTSRDRPIQ